MKLCDEHGADLVNKGMMKPLVKVWGANNTPFKFTNCYICNVEENCFEYPDFLLSEETKKYIEEKKRNAL